MALLFKRVGLTVAEAHEYLNARGLVCTISAVKAWCRGAYNPPLAAIREIWNLEKCIRDDTLEVPPEAPESYRSMRAVVCTMHGWKTDGAVSIPISYSEEPQGEL